MVTRQVHPRLDDGADPTFLLDNIGPATVFTLGQTWQSVVNWTAGHPVGPDVRTMVVMADSPVTDPTIMEALSLEAATQGLRVVLITAQAHGFESFARGSKFWAGHRVMVHVDEQTGVVRLEVVKDGVDGLAGEVLSLVPADEDVEAIVNRVLGPDGLSDSQVMNLLDA